MRKKSVTGLVNGVTNITSFRQHPQRMNRNQREYHINIRHFEQKKKGNTFSFFQGDSQLCVIVCVCVRESMGFCECGGEFSQYREIGFYFFLEHDIHT